jgi:hypothetical protein
MQELWTTYGFYLWALTTALVVLALVWLAWNTFGEAAEDGEESTEVDAALLDGGDERVTHLQEALPIMQATLGRTLQRVGASRGQAADGSSSFALAVANARGDGFVLSGGEAGGVNLKVLAQWAAPVTLSSEESTAILEAQKGQAPRS